MASQEEVVEILKFIQKGHPKNVSEEMNKHEFGTFAVIKYLHDHRDGVKSADICKASKISSARMAVLLKKLEAKDIIKKEASLTDARAILVKLTPNGERMAKKAEEHIFDSISQAIDEIGFEELKNILRKMKRLHEIFQENSIKLKEEENA